jgi:DDE family transposase
MFFRRKSVGERNYLQIVESRRSDRAVRQHVVATLGRAEDWLEAGKLDQLLQSGARLSETALVLSAVRDGEGLAVDSRRIGAPLIFERLWRETGCKAVVEALLADRRFEFPVERAIFASVLHRLCLSGSDRSCDRWLDGYRIADLDGIDLHHLYRAIAWLGEELADQDGRTRSPRCTKDLIEERLFARRRDLFNDLELVFFDTSALYFHGEGGETLGARGKSKDHRPELKQVVIGVVIDRHGRPLCSETWPGNATDVQALLPVIDRLRQRFAIGRICVVADRGMISARTLAELDARGIEYILGTRERSDAEVRESVLTDTAAMVPLCIPKASGTTTDIEVKEVWVRPWDGKGKPRRYVVCYNPARAAWDAAQRGAIIAALQEQLSRGDKSLVGNSGFRKFLKVIGDDHFALDEAKVAEEARLDGFYVLRTNSKLPTLEVAMRYRELWKVEQIFRTTKAVLETRPVYHSSDAAIRGHIFCSFLALTLRKELDDRLQAAGLQLEWQDVIGDLDRLVETTVDSDGRRFVLRNQAPGCAGAVFQAVRVALPPLFHRLDSDKPEAAPDPPAAKPRKRRLTPPDRSATSKNKKRFRQSDQ